MGSTPSEYRNLDYTEEVLMGIQGKKFFYITAAVMLSVLLGASMGLCICTFITLCLRKLVIRQRASVELNRQMADNFVQSGLSHCRAAGQ